MKAPPEHVEPITAGQLRKIIKGLGKRYSPPPDPELAVLAAVLTGWQSCNDDPEWGDPAFVVSVYDERGRARIDKTPPWLRLGFDADKRALGHLRRRKRDRRDLARDIGPRFQQMMQGANPGLPFGSRDGPVARFIAAVIPLVFPGQHSSVPAVGQLLHRRDTRSLKKRD
jgi:hypothetical protein